MLRTFTCEACSEEFESETSDEEADAEFERLFGLKDGYKPERDIIVCEDCFKRLMARFN